MMPDLASLFARHGLRGVPEQPMEHIGFSGARITRLMRPDGTAFVVKRSSYGHDWIMQATDDRDRREARAVALDLPAGVRTAVLGAARDGDGFALLMHDVSNWLLPAGKIDDAALETVLARAAELHATPPPDGFPWCDLRKRLSLLMPKTARIARLQGASVADDVTRGWALFDRHASPGAVRLVRGLERDLTPLLRALSALPPAVLHGDLKLDNIALDPDGRAWLLDWAMTLAAPPAVEIGWFLAVNSRRLPCEPDEVLARYAAAAALPSELRARHDALTVLCGLVLRGWRKALDADEGDASELGWWSARAEAAASLL